MFFRKFALLILTMFIGFAFQANSVSASAKEDVTVENTADTIIVSQDTNTDENNTDNTDTDNTNNTLTDIAVKTTPAPTTTIVNKNSSTTIKDKTTKKAKKKKKKAKYTKKELRLMASIINCEAGGESMQGKIAVGIVIMNRVKSKAFPNTIKKVVYQKGQFSPVRNGALKKRLKQYDAGKIRSKQWKSCISAAKKVLNGQKTVVIKGKKKSMKGMHFFSGYLSRAKIRIGGHRFK